VTSPRRRSGVRRRRLAVAVALAAVLVGAVVLVVRASDAGSKPKRQVARHQPTGGTLRLLSDADYTSLDPALLVTPRQRDVGRLVYRTLMTYGDDGRSRVPDLATAAGVPTERGRVWTYQLRPDTRYEDGSAITAADVVRGIRRSRARGSVPLGLLADARAAGPTTVVLVFTKPFADADALVALTSTAPVPAKGPLASGPYEVASLKPGVSFRLVRNPAWDASTDAAVRAGPDEVDAELRLDGASIDRRLAASAGADALAVTDKPVLDIVPAVPDDRIVHGPDGSVLFTAMDIRRGPFADIKVRQALEVGYPLAATRAAAGGAAVAADATDLLPPSFPGHQDLDSYGQEGGHFTGDPERARQLLAEAGYADGVTITTLVPRTRTAAAVATALTAGLAKAGFRLRVTTVDAADYYDAVGAPSRQPDLISFAWSADWPTPSAIIPPLFTCAALTASANHNVADHCDHGFDQQVDIANAEPDADVRDEMWAALDRRLVEEAIVVPRSFGVSTSIIGARVLHARSALAFGGAVDLVNLTLA
jgi:peptide/nickel transport system substrate-binding protein